MAKKTKRAKKSKNLNDTFDKGLGIKRAARKKGYSRIELRLKKHHLNHGGIVHGGVLATLCDITLADAVTSVLNKDEWCVTIELTIQYMSPAFLGETIYGVGKLTRRGKTLAFTDGGVEGKDGRRIVKAQGIWFIKKGPSKRVKVSKPVKRMD